MDPDQPVAAQYGAKDLPGRFLAAAAAAGLDVERLHPAELAAADEFHVGGRQATVDLAGQLDVDAGTRLLDVGSGPGGASRYFAAEYGCHVTGVDLTPSYVELATELAGRTGLADRLSYRVADATDLPLPAGSVDGGYLLHVGMNVADKELLCAELARVLTPGGFFAIYDVMRIGEGDLDYPQPWADDPAISFLQTPTHYRSCLEKAGFVVDPPRERREFAIESLRTMRERIAADGLPALGLHLLMGPGFGQKITNLVAGLEAAVIAPVQMIAKLPR